MGSNSKIEWTDHTFNPWRGCSKVSPACKNCYAMELELYRAWHHAQPEFVASAKPCEGDHLTLDDVRARMFRLIDATPNLDWLILSKRPENIIGMWPSPKSFGYMSRFYGPKGFDGSGSQPEKLLPRSNVWLGTTVENQEQADKRIPELLKCRDLSPVLFLSCEPLLGPIEFSDVTFRSDAVQQLGRKAMDGIDWVITGGESGKGFRPMESIWVRTIYEQCKAAGVSFFCKQGAGPKSGQQYDLPDYLFGVKEFPCPN